MLLELEIARLTGWVEARIMPPATAAYALKHLISAYLRAAGRPVDLTLFEGFARARFERFHAAECPEPLYPIIAARATRLLNTHSGSKACIVRVPPKSNTVCAQTMSPRSNTFTIGDLDIEIS